MILSAITEGVFIMQTLNKKVFRRGDSSIYAYEGGEWKLVPGSTVFVHHRILDGEKYACYQGIKQCLGSDVWFGCSTGATEPTIEVCNWVRPPPPDPMV